MRGKRYEERKLDEEFGPVYDLESAALKRARRLANAGGGLRSLDPWERDAYVQAVRAAVLAKQRAWLTTQRAVAPPNCASGTWHSEGADIHKAVQAQQRGALAACPSQVRRARTDEQWIEMYAAAMAEKRAAQGFMLEAAE